jgi:acyl carrier protein
MCPANASPTKARTAEEIVAELRSWIVAQNAKAAVMDLDTDIVENRLVDSLNFIDFVLLLEELRGAEIPEEQVDAERFRTLRTIHTNFLC